MTTKMKHRILGLMVLIALIILLIPLFQSNKDIPTENTIVKAPPFPEQAATVSNATEIPPPSLNSVQPDDTITNNKPVLANQTVELPKPDNIDFVKSETVTPVTEVQNEVKPNSEIAAKEEQNKKESELNAVTTMNLSSKNPNEIIKDTPKNEDKVVALNTPKIKEKTQKAETKRNKSLPALLSHDNNGLAKLKSAVWVIQIGNYKNKTKAINLVNRLRANGYPAFIQQVSTAFGDSTRVFVGPAYKQTAANELANRLAKQNHIHGIVISYKPLSL